MHLKEKEEERIEYYKIAEERYGQLIYNPIFEECNKEQVNAIVERNPNGKVIIHSMLRPEIRVNFMYEYLPFNKLIAQKIENRITIAVADVSMKDRYILGYWYLTNNKQEVELSKELFHKQWAQNTICGGKAITLLDLLEVLGRKSYYIS